MIVDHFMRHLAEIIREDMPDGFMWLIWRAGGKINGRIWYCDRAAEFAIHDSIPPGRLRRKIRRWAEKAVKMLLDDSPCPYTVYFEPENKGIYIWQELVPYAVSPCCSDIFCTDPTHIPF